MPAEAGEEPALALDLAAPADPPEDALDVAAPPEPPALVPPDPVGSLDPVGSPDSVAPSDMGPSEPEGVPDTPDTGGSSDAVGPVGSPESPGFRGSLTGALGRSVPLPLPDSALAPPLSLPDAVAEVVALSVVLGSPDSTRLPFEEGTCDTVPETPGSTEELVEPPTESLVVELIISSVLPDTLGGIESPLEVTVAESELLTETLAELEGRDETVEVLVIETSPQVEAG